MSLTAAKKKSSLGRVGKDGSLFLSLRQSDAKTILARQRSEPPLCVQRALYCEHDLPEMAYVYLSSTSGGMLQGDTYTINFDLGPETKAHITTQGAARIYGTDRHDNALQAVQRIKMSLGENAYLEYIPDQIIPYADSRFTQETALSIHETATIIYAETVTSGRAGMGESFAYESCNLRMRAADQNQTFRFVDSARMTPLRSPGISTFGIMNKYGVISSLYILTKQKHVQHLQKNIEKIILQRHNDTAVDGGAAVMSGRTGVLVRLLGDDNESVKSVVNESVACARKMILDAPFTNVRKC